MMYESLFWRATRCHIELTTTSRAVCVNMSRSSNIRSVSKTNRQLARYKSRCFDESTSNTESDIFEPCAQQTAAYGIPAPSCAVPGVPLDGLQVIYVDESASAVPALTLDVAVTVQSIAVKRVRTA